MPRISLRTDKELFEVANKLSTAYRTAFTTDTVTRATTFVEGAKNPSRNYMWGIIMNTQGKSGKLTDVYHKKTAEALVKLTIHGLSQPQAKSANVDAF